MRRGSMMSLWRGASAAARLPGVARSFSRLGYERRSAQWDPAETEVSMRGKTCVVTGANSGIGLATARALAERDADLWLLCRDQERGAAAREALREVGGGEVSLALADLSDLGSVRRGAEAIAADVVDVLVHNAGALYAERRESVDGLELTYALHVAGPQLLTALLQSRLRRAQPGRVIFVSSGGMYAEPLDVEDLQWERRRYAGSRVYAQCKRAQVALVRSWSERAGRREICFHAMHPGWVDTPGVASSLPGFHRVTRRWLRTAEQGADTVVWLAISEAGGRESGGFYLDREAQPTELLPGTSVSDADRQALWAALDRQIAAFRG